MSTPVALWDIVGVAENIFLIAVVPLQRELKLNVIPSRAERQHCWVELVFLASEVFNKRLDSAFIFKDFLCSRPFVHQFVSDARIEEGQLPESLRQNIVV